MFAADDIHALTDFTRKTKEHIAHLKKTGRPEILTVNGKAEIVVQDARAYEKLIDLADSLETIKAIQESMDSFNRGEGLSALDSMEALRTKHGISN